MKPGRLPGVLIAVIAFFALAYLALSLAWPVVHDLVDPALRGLPGFRPGPGALPAIYRRQPAGHLSCFSAPSTGRPAACAAVDPPARSGGAGVYRRGERGGAAPARPGSRHLRRRQLRRGLPRDRQDQYAAAARIFVRAQPLALSIALVSRAARTAFGAPAASRRRCSAACWLGLVFNIKPPLLVCWLPLLAYAATIPRRADGGRRALLLPAALFAAGRCCRCCWCWAGSTGWRRFSRFSRWRATITRSTPGSTVSGTSSKAAPAEFAVRYQLRPVILFCLPLVFLAGLGLLAASRPETGALWPNARPWRRSRRPPSSTCRSAANFGPTTRSRFSTRWRSAPVFAFGREARGLFSESGWRAAVLAVVALTCVPWAPSPKMPPTGGTPKSTKTTSARSRRWSVTSASKPPRTRRWASSTPPPAPCTRSTPRGGRSTGVSSTTSTSTTTPRIPTSLACAA